MHIHVYVYVQVTTRMHIHVNVYVQVTTRMHIHVYVYVQVTTRMHIHTYHTPTLHLCSTCAYVCIHTYTSHYYTHYLWQHGCPYCSTAARIHTHAYTYISHNYTYCSTCGARSIKLVFVTQPKATPHLIPSRGGGVYARHSPNRAADVLSSCSTLSHITPPCCHSVNWRSSSRSKRVGALFFRRAGVLLNVRMSRVFCCMSFRSVGVFKAQGGAECRVYSAACVSYAQVCLRYRVAQTHRMP